MLKDMFDFRLTFGIHRHIYSVLDCYLDRKESKFEGFILCCECGHTKLACLPKSIIKVRTVYSK